MKKLNYIDALRGIAILLVLFVHCAQFGKNIYGATLNAIIDNGARGVQLFYVASAFTLFRSMTLRHESSTKNFFIRRFFRIAPMYYLAIIYYLWQNGLHRDAVMSDYPFEVSKLNILSNFLFVHGVSPYWITSVVPGGWSIAVEEMFYCLLPFLFWKIKNLNQALLFFICAILLRASLQIFFTHFQLIADTQLWKNYLFLYLPSQLPVFACGVVLFFLLKPQKVNVKILAVLGALILVQLFTRLKIFFPEHIEFAIGFIVLAFVLSKVQFKALVNPATILIGRISYSMYITHFLVIYWLVKFGVTDFVNNNALNLFIRYLIFVGVTASVSFVTYNLIEKPCIKLGKLIIAGNKKTPATLSSHQAF